MTKTVEQIAKELKEKLKPSNSYKSTAGYKYYEDISGWHIGGYYNLVIFQSPKGKIHINIAHTTKCVQTIKGIIKKISPTINISSTY